MLSLTFEEKYNAIGRKETLYEGMFITAVITTGIFCRPSCRARKPKAENVIFYDTTEQAIQNGFRPCKICKPMEVEGQTPTYIQQLLKELHNNPHNKIKDVDLKQRNILPHEIRQWFKKYHAVTFHAYQRMLRINAAYRMIKQGNSVTETAFEVGYESLSGFEESFKNIFGDTPVKTKDKNVINIIRFTTLLGPMFACATQNGVCLLEFTDRRMLETELRDVCKRLNAVILPGYNKHLEQVEKEITEYFEGKRQEFSVQLETSGTEFQQKVWQSLLAIPYGRTRSYQQLANELNNPKAVRAVAMANGYNKVAIIIPCHRVIGNDGSLTGYGGGLSRKKWLLTLENQNSSQGFQQELF